MKFNFKKMIDSQISKSISNFDCENPFLNNLNHFSSHHKNEFSYLNYHKAISDILRGKSTSKSENELLNNSDNLLDYSLLTAEKNNNCLALTIKKDYKLTSLVNIAIRSCRMTFKVLVSYFALNIIKFFF